MNKHKKWSLGMRIYHWLNSLLVVLIFITVALRKTFLDAFDLSKSISKYLLGVGIEIEKEKSLELAELLRDEMWQWHYYFGMALAGLIVYRIALIFTKSGRISINGALSMLGKSKQKDAWIQMLYQLVYIAIFVMAASGLTMYFAQELSISEDAYQAIEGVHVAVMNIIIYFIPFHIIGVVLAENEDQSGITSDMINGGKV